MLVQKENIISIIPQRTPVIMIDKLIMQNEQTAICDFKIETENIFVRDGVFQESGMIENIAQTAAAGAGWHYLQGKLEPPVCYIGAIKNLKINRYPKVGETIQTTTELKAKALSISLLLGSIFIDEELVAECEMKIVYDS